MNMMKSWKIRLHVITPVHIGCGEVYEPTGFYVDTVRKKLVSFDPLDFVTYLSPEERTRFLTLCEKGTVESIVEIYRFMASVQNRPAGYEVEVSDGFLENYRKVLGLMRDQVDKELNNFQISRTSFLPHDNLPYIPGSALKGSLRTGWLNHLNERAQRRVNRKEAKTFETELMGGSFKTDPFRMLKVPDLVPSTSPATRICYAVNKKKTPSKHEARGPQQILEVIIPESAVFEGIITIHDAKGLGAQIPKPIPSSLDLFAKATSFFNREMDNEETVLKGIKLPAAVRQKMTGKFGDKFMKSVFPVRIGRHSSAECLTIEGVRNIKILGHKAAKDRYESHATTLWLAADSKDATSKLIPFGWCAIELEEVDPSRLTISRPDIRRVSASQPLPPVEVIQKPSIVSDSVTWQNATLSWNPGTATLIATSTEGKKAETRERSLVADEVITRMKKGKIVKATVFLEQQGNTFRIIKVEVPN